jgi:hypothetical protein
LLSASGRIDDQDDQKRKREEKTKGKKGKKGKKKEKQEQKTQYVGKTLTQLVFISWQKKLRG